MQPESKHKKLSIFLRTIYLILAVLSLLLARSVNAQSTQSNSVGIEGKISSPPPTTPASITFPSNGQTFNTLPIKVAGLCPKGLLVRLYKNNVFSGSADCSTGSYTIVTDLYNGQNDLVARVYDALDQAGPDSNNLSVTYNSPLGIVGTRISLTSNYAKKGANPGDNLGWPVILSGGLTPYALSVDWGDGKSQDLKSVDFPGTINLTHIYDSPGVYNVIIKATDKNGDTAFLQLVGVGNGPIDPNTQNINLADQKTQDMVARTKILWQPAAVMVPLMGMTFLLGQKFELRTLRRRIEKGDRPFKK